MFCFVFWGGVQEILAQKVKVDLKLSQYRVMSLDSGGYCRVYVFAASV